MCLKAELTGNIIYSVTAVALLVEVLTNRQASSRLKPGIEFVACWSQMLL